MGEGHADLEGFVIVFEAYTAGEDVGADGGVPDFDCDDDGTDDEYVISQLFRSCCVKLRVDCDAHHARRMARIWH